MADNFCEYDFQRWVDDEVGFHIWKHADRDRESDEDIRREVQDKVDALDSMQLVCLLGRYLTITIGD